MHSQSRLVIGQYCAALPPQVWDASLAIVELLNAPDSWLLPALAGRRVLELGSGTGLAGEWMREQVRSGSCTHLPCKGHRPPSADQHPLSQLHSQAAPPTAL
jgi:hypothetical protein